MNPVTRLLSYFILIISVFMLSSGAARAEIGGSWQLHPGASLHGGYSYTHTAKAIATPAYTYFIARGTPINRHNSYKLEESNVLLRIDAVNPDKGARAAASELPLSGTQIDWAEYCPTTGALVVTYLDGMIDVIHDSGDVTPLPFLRDDRSPLRKRIRSISFGIDGRCYLATSFGFVAFDSADGANPEIVNLSTETDYVLRHGDRLLLAVRSADRYTDLYSIPAAAPRTPTATDMVKIAMTGTHANSTDFNSSVGHLRCIESLYPLTDKTFLAVTYHSNSLCAFAVTPGEGDDAWKALPVVTQEAVATSASVGGYGISSWQYCHTGDDYFNLYGQAVNHQRFLDGIPGYWREGPMLNGNLGFILVRQGHDPDFTAADPVADFRSRAAVRIPRLSYPADKAPYETVRHAATFDGSRFWTYNDNKGFFYRDILVSDAQTWPATVQFQPRSADFPFHGPEAFYVNTLEYSPEYGILARSGQRGRTNLWQEYVDQLSGYKDGKWTQLGIAHTEPTLTKATSNVFGAVSDPIAPGRVWGTHWLFGLSLYNPADPTPGDGEADFLVLGNYMTNNNYSLYGLYPDNQVPVVATSELFPQLLDFSVPVFDADGTMWATQACFDASDGASELVAHLYSWTADDRRAVIEAGRGNYRDAYLEHPMHLHEIKGLAIPLFLGSGRQLLALKHPDNRNLLAYTYNAWVDRGSNVFILDTNGTPYDDTDDRFMDITDVVDSVSRDPLWKYQYEIFGISEDPSDGRLWVFTTMGPVSINPRALLDNPREAARPLQAVTESYDGNPTEGTAYTGAAYDAAGRMWLISNTEGVTCISADRKQVLGVFNKSNSPLPSDNVLSCAFNPETGSIFFGTDAGIAEFYPDGETPAGPTVFPGNVRVWPEFPTPEYRGAIRFEGLDDKTSYHVLNSEGKEVGFVTDSVDGVGYWFIYNYGKRKRYPTGLYSICPLGSNVAVATVFLLE